MYIIYIVHCILCISKQIHRSFFKAHQDAMTSFLQLLDLSNKIYLIELILPSISVRKVRNQNLFILQLLK